MIFNLGMNLYSEKYPAISFSIKCAIVGGLAMFLCMAAGGLFVDRGMFNDFINKPTIWPLVFFETAVWLLPFMLLIVPLLNKLKSKEPKSAAKIIAVSWIVIGLLVAAGYNYAYFASDWSVSQITRPDVTFGWTLPYLMILVSFVYLSMDYLKTVRRFSA